MTRAESRRMARRPADAGRGLQRDRVETATDTWTSGDAQPLTPADSIDEHCESDAQGRLDHGPPIAVIDIGSNSVRLVVYEGLTRSPTELFNEKALCGLGREVQSTRLLAADAVAARAGDAQALSRAVPDAWA